MRLRCLGESLIIAPTSADLCREVDSVLPCLPRLKLSRCVRFTNRFTNRFLACGSPSSGGQEIVPGPARTPPPNPTAAEPDVRRVLSWVGVADHEVTPKAPWTGSGWREHSYGGFGGGHPPCRHRYLANLSHLNPILQYLIYKSVRQPTLDLLGVVAGILGGWAGIRLIFSSVMPAPIGPGRSGWPGS